MEIVPLGTNGFFPSFGRQTACYAIKHNKRLILLDAGSGLFRLAEPKGKELLKNISEVDLFLSHYHLDHTFGFYAAFQLLKRKKVTVFAYSGRQVFSEFITLKYFPINYTEKHKNFYFRLIGEGEYKTDDYKVKVRKQKHRNEESLGYNFDFGLAYITDTDATPEGYKFFEGAKILLHEHGVAGEDIKTDKIQKHVVDGHVTSSGAAMIAQKAKVGKLVLVHHNPFFDDKKLAQNLKVARGIFPRIELGNDLKKIEF